MLRSVYSGDETYLEPIRLHTFKDGSGALETVKYGMELVPLTAEEEAEQGKEWHIFGKVFQYVSTPMNTEELSLAASLPRRDVPGLRFVKTAVRFANNPAEFAGDSITLGRVVDTGVIQNNEYKIDPHALVPTCSGNRKYRFREIYHLQNDHQGGFRAGDSGSDHRTGERRLYEMGGTGEQETSGGQTFPAVYARRKRV